MPAATGFRKMETLSSGHRVEAFTRVKRSFRKSTASASKGVASVYQVSARTMATNGFDLSGLLPLWTVGIPPDHANALIDHLTNSAEFWRTNGILMFSARDPYYDPARAEGSVGVWAYWLTLMGEGLIEHERFDLATELLKRLLRHKLPFCVRPKTFMSSIMLTKHAV